jgi:hypothetical protein
MSTYDGMEKITAGMRRADGIDETLTPAGILIRTILIGLLKENLTRSTRKQAHKQRGRGRSRRGRKE